MIEATNSSLTILMLLFILVPAVIIVVLAMGILSAGKNNDSKNIDNIK